MILSSEIVYLSINPMALQISEAIKSLCLKVKRRISQDSVIFSFMRSGLIPTRDELKTIQDTIESWDDHLGEDPFPLFHRFSNGIYKREIHIPKNHVIVGKIHKSEYFVNVLKGRLIVISEFGSEEIQAPVSFVGKAGVKHVVLTFEDTIWEDTYRTNATNIKDAEKELYTMSYSDLDESIKVIEMKQVIN